MGADAVVPPLPDGFKLDEIPPLPAGFQLDSAQATPSGPVDFLKQATRFTLPSLGLQATDWINKALEKAAYKTGGAVTDITGSPGLGLAANVGVQAVPAVVGGIAGSQLAPKMAGKAFDLMASAAKPNLSQWESGEAKRAIDTLLKEGISPTEGGVEVLKSKIGALNDKIKQAISTSQETVNVGNTGKPILDILDRFSKQVASQDDLASIRRVWSMYRNHPLFGGQQDIPIQLAQQLKQGTYKQLEGKYGELTSAETEAQKAIARGLKDEIAAKIPALSKLNAKESELLNALSVAERRALLDLNSNPGGLVWLYHHPTAAAGYLAARSAPFKAMVARMLYNVPGAVPTAAGAIGGAGYDVMTQQAP